MPISPLGLLDRVLHGRAQQTYAVTSSLPLQGLTVLAVEDSRFASDVLRMMCQRSGARLRRAETLQAAYAHLRVYRPDVIVVDLGLPDGRGDALIRDLAQHRVHGPVVIGLSGDPDGQTVALAAGADGFVEKPFPGLAIFQREILRHLPDRADRHAPNAAEPPPTVDLLALRDDMGHAASLIHGTPNSDQRQYVAGFVAGLGRVSNDPALAAAAFDLHKPDGLAELRNLLAARIASTQDAFKNIAPD